MIKIEVTGNSIGEVADKLLAIGRSLHSTASNAPMQLRITASGDMVREVAEAASVDPTPTPLASPVEETASSSAEEKVSSGPTEATPPAGKLDFELDVAPVVLRAVGSKGKPFVQDVLSEFGSERASQLDTALWPELIARLEAEMA